MQTDKEYYTARLLMNTELHRFISFKDFSACQLQEIEMSLEYLPLGVVVSLLCNRLLSWQELEHTRLFLEALVNVPKIDVKVAID